MRRTLPGEKVRRKSSRARHTHADENSHGDSPRLVTTARDALKRRMFSRLIRRLSGKSTMPTLMHITHPKAGSTWVTIVLHELFGDSVAPRGRSVAEATGGDLAQHVFETGLVYPSMFMTREQVLAHPELNGCKRFIVIRDLRDTLTALYFSLKMSSRSEGESLGNQLRDALNDRDEEAGLLYLIDARIADIAAIQTSWLKQGEIVLRYEDLRENGFDLLRDAFLGRLAMPVSERALSRAIGSAPIERGRRTGAVDWRKHFTPKIRERFAAEFGSVLIDAGYEKDLAWAREPSSTQSPASL